MYYAEKIVKGILYCRYSPNARWQKASLDAVNRRLVETMKQVERLDAAYKTASAEGATMYTKGYGDGRESVTNELVEHLVCQLNSLIG